MHKIPHEQPELRLNRRERRPIPSRAREVSTGRSGNQAAQAVGRHCQQQSTPEPPRAGARKKTQATGSAPRSRPQRNKQRDKRARNGIARGKSGGWGVRIRTSGRLGGLVADDGDLVDDGDVAEHGGQLGLGHELGHLADEELDGALVPAARVVPAGVSCSGSASRGGGRGGLLLVPVAGVLCHWARVGCWRASWLAGWLA